MQDFPPFAISRLISRLMNTIVTLRLFCNWILTVCPFQLRNLLFYDSVPIIQANINSCSSSSAELSVQRCGGAFPFSLFGATQWSQEFSLGLGFCIMSCEKCPLTAAGNLAGLRWGQHWSYQVLLLHDHSGEKELIHHPMTALGHSVSNL